MEDRKVKITEIFAHRGACGYEPENTMEAFALAVEQGADGIELDVQFTADRRLVVFHDDTLDRMTPAKGFVHDMPWAEFSAQPLAGSDEHPPLFADMLRTVAEANPDTPLIVEIKSRSEYKHTYLEELCRATIAELKTYPALLHRELRPPRRGHRAAAGPRSAARSAGRQLPELPQDRCASRARVRVLPLPGQLFGAA